MLIRVDHAIARNVEVQVWHVMAADDRTFAVLDQNECLRAQRFRQPEDANRFVTGRFAVRTALAQRLGVRPEDVLIEIAANGRPFCRSGPTFSISHSGDVMLLAMTDHTQLSIGVDVEMEDRKIDFSTILPRIGSAQEQAWVGSVGADCASRFFELWTAKEAALKSKGLGLGIDPRLAVYDPASRRVSYAAQDCLTPATIVPINVPFAHRAALAFDQLDAGSCPTG